MLNKYKNLPKSIKASLWFMFCSVLQKGISFITIPIFTRLMSPAEYGDYSLFLSWQEILMIFATLNLNYQVFNNGMVKFKTDKDGYTTSMVGLAFISSIITFLVITSLYKLWYTYTGINYTYIIMMAINMFALVVIGLWTVRKRYDFEYKNLVIITVLMSLLNPLLGVLLVKFSNYKLFFRIFSIMITSVIFGFIIFISLYKKSKTLYNKNYWKYALKLAIPLIPHYISMVILHSSDRIMIGNIVGKDSVAFYSISYNVAMVMQIILNSINASFIPWVYHKVEKKDYLPIKKYSFILVLFVAIICLLPMLFAPEAIMILGGKQYIDAINIVPILSTSVYLIFLYSIFIIVEMYFEKSNYITIGSVCAAIINLITNFFFIKMYGYKAAAYTTLFSYIALSIFHYLMYKKVCKKNEIYDSIFDVKKMTIISMILIVFSIIVTATYSNNIVRYSLIGLIIMLVIIYRKKIINLLSIFKDIKKKEGGK